MTIRKGFWGTGVCKKNASREKNGFFKYVNFKETETQPTPFQCLKIKSENVQNNASFLAP